MTAHRCVRRYGSVSAALRKLDEYEGMLESGYAFCHPCDDCAGQRAAVEQGTRVLELQERYRRLLVRALPFVSSGVPNLRAEIAEEVKR